MPSNQASESSTRWSITHRSCQYFLSATLLVVSVFACEDVDAQTTVASTLGATIGDDVNVTSFEFVNLPVGFFDNTLREDLFGSAGDMFGYGRRAPLPGDDTLPFAILDDSLDNFTAETDPTEPFVGDLLGIIKDADMDDFFGIVDTVNPDTTGLDSVMAQWVFNVSSAGSDAMTFAVDIAAMGDFEANEIVDFEYSFDGTNFSPLLSISFDGDISADYTLEGIIYQVEIDNGTFPDATAGDDRVVTEDDPMLVGGVGGTVLTNEFANFTAPIPNGGSTLTLRVTADIDGGSEAVAFRNIVITTGGSATLVGDYNNDTVVDVADYTVWRDAYNDGVNTSPLMFGDLTPGTTIDDYLAWKNAFGNSVPGAVVTATPEPATAAMVLIGFLAAAVRRR